MIPHVGATKHNMERDFEEGIAVYKESSGVSIDPKAEQITAFRVAYEKQNALADRLTRHSKSLIYQLLPWAMQR